MSDFRLALRGLRKSPALVTTAILSLALGIGTNVTVFSIVREMILDDLSASHPDRLARVEGVDVSYQLYRQLRVAGAFEDLAFHRGLHDRIWSAGDHGEIVWIVTTSANFFDVLGVHASTGRLYSQSDDGREVAVLSYGFWQRRLYGRTATLGQTIELNGRLYTVVGVLPKDYRSVYGHGVSPEVYLSDRGNADPHDRVYALIGRLRDGSTREQARGAFAAAFERLKGADSLRRNIEVRPLSGLSAHASMGGDERRFLLFFMMLFALAGTLMLIGCANVAGLLIARALNRKRELAVRKALGANRLQLLRPLLAEGILLAIGGAAVAFVFDGFLRERLSYIRWPSAYGLPFEFHFQNDGGLFLYGSLLALIALMLSSLVPALRGAGADINIALKQGEPAYLARKFNLRSAFVIVQVALSIVLLAVSSLFTRSLFYVVDTGPGFDLDHTLIAAVHTLPGRHSGTHAWDFRQQALRRLYAIPGVVSVTSTGTLPLMGELPDVLLRPEAGPASQSRHAYVIGAGENYCTTLHIPIIRGRDFEAADRGRKPTPVIVNRTLAREFFPGRDPIGQLLITGRDGQDRLQVIGVAAHAKMRTLGEGEAPVLFRPEFNGQFLVRVSGAAANWIAPFRSALDEMDSTAAVDVRPLAEASAGALFPLRVATAFVGSFSVLGVALALIGLYGSVSYAVGRRTREFGIRAALGASRSQIIWTALRDGIAILLCGGAIGGTLSAMAVRPLADLVPAGVDPWAPAPLLEVVFLLLATGLAASWIPARRAAAAQPSIALREY